MQLLARIPTYWLYNNNFFVYFRSLTKWKHSTLHDVQVDVDV